MLLQTTLYHVPRIESFLYHALNRIDIIIDLAGALTSVCFPTRSRMSRGQVVGCSQNNSILPMPVSINHANNMSGASLVSFCRSPAIFCGIPGRTYSFSIFHVNTIFIFFVLVLSVRLLKLNGEAGLHCQWPSRTGKEWTGPGCVSIPSMYFLISGIDTQIW